MFMKACERAAAVKNKLKKTNKRSDDRKYVCVLRLAHPQKSLIPVSVEVSIDGLFDNLESRKRNYYFGKMSQKGPEFCMPIIIFETWHMKQRLRFLRERNRLFFSLL